MPYLNEEEEVINTINSIYETSNKDIFDILVVDDCSKDTYDFSRYKEVKYVKNEKRIGSGASKHKGAMLSKTPYVFIIDAHMRFRKDNWLDKIIECIGKEPNTAWCTTCLGLDKNNMDVYNPDAKYHAANMLIYDKTSDKNRPSREIIEPKWKNFEHKTEYEVPCILGANYGFSKKWYSHIKGMKGLKMWGTEEPFLSIKTWMAGGKCKIRTDIEIGHKFRRHAPYVTDIAPLYFNKIYFCKTLLPDDLSEKIINFLPKNINYKTAMDMIEKEKMSIEEDRAYYKSIFKSDIYDYCRKFNIGI